MDEKERLLKEEMQKIHELEREVREIEKLEKQEYKAEKHRPDKSHEKAKRAITHGDPASGLKEFLLKSKFIFIGAFVAIVVLCIVLIPTKTIEVIEPVERTELEAYNITEEAWVSENTTITEEVSFMFETKVVAFPSLSGTKEQYVLWEVIIGNFEEEEGCWEYDYTVYVNNNEHDSGTIENMCVVAEESKTFTTPLYDLGHINEGGSLEYSLEIEPVVIPTRTMSVTMPQTILKQTNVTKYRNITKITNETTNKTVNWLLGFSIF
jgi:hypothetical protein